MVNSSYANHSVFMEGAERQYLDKLDARYFRAIYYLDNSSMAKHDDVMMSFFAGTKGLLLLPFMILTEFMRSGLQVIMVVVIDSLFCMV